MLRRTFLASGAGVLAGCSQRKKSGQRAKLRISTTTRLTMCPFYVAYESGYFAVAGLDIELVKEMGTAQSLPLLAGGQLDASLTAFGPPVVNAIARGARVRVVAGREITSASCGSAGTLFVNGKRFPNGIRNLAELR